MMSPGSESAGPKTPPHFSEGPVSCDGPGERPPEPSTWLAHKERGTVPCAWSRLFP